MHIIDDMPVASQLSTLKVEVLDASHCPLLGRVPGRITAKYMGEHWEESSSTGHFRLMCLKVHALTSPGLRCDRLPDTCVLLVTEGSGAMAQDCDALLSACLPGLSPAHGLEPGGTLSAGGASVHACMHARRFSGVTGYMLAFHHPTILLKCTARCGQEFAGADGNCSVHRAPSEWV